MKNNNLPIPTVIGLPPLPPLPTQNERTEPRTELRTVPTVILPPLPNNIQMVTGLPPLPNNIQMVTGLPPLPRLNNVPIAAVNPLLPLLPPVIALPPLPNNIQIVTGLPPLPAAEPRTLPDPIRVTLLPQFPPLLPLPAAEPRTLPTNYRPIPTIRTKTTRNIFPDEPVVINDIIKYLQNNFARNERYDPEIKSVNVMDTHKINLLTEYDQVIRERDGSFLFEVMRRDPREVADNMKGLWGNFAGTKDETIALYWWGIIYKNLSILYSTTIINQTNNLTTEQLNSTVPVDWPYPRDRASLMFRILTGYNPPRADATKEPRYLQIINTDPEIIIKLAEYVYRFSGSQQQGKYSFYSHYTPYRHVALQEISILEPFVLQYRPENTNALAARMGMRIPIETVDFVKYYFKNMKWYEKVLTRDPTRLVPVPDLFDIPKKNIINLLEKYTDDELLDGYELISKYVSYNYTGREDLLNKIADNPARTNNAWYFRARNCLNADRDNIYEMSQRVNKISDPLISYGTMKNYRCWNLDELEGAWEETNTFIVPDWRVGDPYKIFPTDTIKQLRTLLLNTRNPIFSPLINRIDENLRYLSDANYRVRQYQQHYLSLSDSDKEIVRKYLSWMFITAMYMRFWKGPGNRYPEVWVEGGTENDLCDPGQRVLNVANQFIYRSELLERIDPELVKWLLEFPRIEYKFTDGTSIIGMETVNYIVEEAQRGKFCLAAASDILIQTSYFLLTNILGTDINGFNQVVNTYLGMDQRPFDPIVVTRTRHTDPTHTLQRL